MYSEILKIQRSERKSRTLTSVDETFFQDCTKYCKTLEENKDFTLLTNVLSILDEIKSKRLGKIFQKLTYNIDQVEEIPNLTSLEASLVLDLKSSIEKYNHYLKLEEEVYKD